MLKTGEDLRLGSGRSRGRRVLRGRDHSRERSLEPSFLLRRKGCSQDMSTKLRQFGHNPLGLYSANQQKKGGTVGFQVLRQRSDKVVVNAVIDQRSGEGPGPGSHETAHRKAG